jgi:hypothetical protein
MMSVSRSYSQLHTETVLLHDSGFWSVRESRKDESGEGKARLFAQILVAEGEIVTA